MQNGHLCTDTNCINMPRLRNWSPELGAYIIARVSDQTSTLKFSNKMSEPNIFNAGDNVPESFYKKIIPILISCRRQIILGAPKIGIICNYIKMCEKYRNANIINFINFIDCCNLNSIDEIYGAALSFYLSDEYLLSEWYNNWHVRQYVDGFSIIDKMNAKNPDYPFLDKYFKYSRNLFFTYMGFNSGTNRNTVL